MERYEVIPHAEGAAVFVNSFRCRLSGDKAFLALLTDEAFAPMLTAAERALVARTVPWTRKLYVRGGEAGAVARASRRTVINVSAGGGSVPTFIVNSGGVGAHERPPRAHSRSPPDARSRVNHSLAATCS